MQLITIVKDYYMVEKYQLICVRKRGMNSHGYTLVELILYSVIALIVVGFSLSLIRTTSKSYTRDRRKSRMQTEGRNAVLMMAREIVNTGFKTYLDEDEGVYTQTTVGNTTTGDVYPGSGESADDKMSSFTSTPGAIYDELEIIKITLDNNGEHDETQRIRYYMSGTTLMRGLRLFSGGWGGESPMEIANNVEALQFRFSTDNNSWTDDPEDSKKDVVAIQIHLLIRTSKEVAMKVNKTYTLGDVTIIPPTDERYLHRLYVETVEVVNNGT